MQGIVYRQDAVKYTLVRDDIQGRFFVLDDMRRTSRGDDIPILWIG